VTATEYCIEDIDHVRNSCPTWLSPEGATDILSELLAAGWRPPLRHPEDGYDVEGPVKTVFNELMLWDFGIKSNRGPVADSIVRRLQRDGFIPRDEDADERRQRAEEDFDREMDAARAEDQRVSALDAAARVMAGALADGHATSINPDWVASVTIKIARGFELYVRGDDESH
jgi:hypothetical protein